MLQFLQCLDATESSHCAAAKSPLSARHTAGFARYQGMSVLAQSMLWLAMLDTMKDQEQDNDKWHFPYYSPSFWLLSALWTFFSPYCCTMRGSEDLTRGSAWEDQRPEGTRASWQGNCPRLVNEWMCSLWVPANYVGQWALRSCHDQVSAAGWNKDPGLASG